jgi:uncharacterized membrane protein YozB (DUF420 family)
MDRATFTLIVEILFYLVLCAGVVAQLKRKYKWHDRLQAPVVVLNIFFIIFVMIPTFRLAVVAQLPSGLSDVPTLVTLLHGLLGTIAQLLGIYVFLAGFKILPRKIGVLKYWMRAAFAFWTLTVLMGIAVYVLFYTGVAAGGGAVAEHDADIITAEPVETSETVVAEHDEAEVSQPQTEVESPATEEIVAEHDEEIVVVEPTEEVVIAEHDEAVVAEVTEEASPPAAGVSEHDADLAGEEVAVAEEDDDLMETLIDEHAADSGAVVEPEYSGEIGFVSWEKLNPTSAETPGIRYEHGMQYNEATDQVFVFGGRDGNQVYNDLWVLNVEKVIWQRLGANAPVAPPARYNLAMIVDAAGQNIYITAGHSPGGQSYNDIWRFEVASETWTDLTPTAATPPAARYGTPGLNIGDGLVLTHGFGGGRRYDDTWRFDLASGQWSNITPAGALPVGRCLFAATASEQRLVMHGGCATPNGPCFLDDAWVLDTTTEAWTQVLSEVKPVGRQYQTLVDITGRDQLILYGGQDASRAARDDIWFLHLDTGQWQLVDSEVKPPARYNHAAVWIPRYAGMLIFGGRNDGGGLADLWLGYF